MLNVRPMSCESELLQCYLSSAPLKIIQFQADYHPLNSLNIIQDLTYGVTKSEYPGSHVTIQSHLIHCSTLIVQYKYQRESLRPAWTLPKTRSRRDWGQTCWKPPPPCLSCSLLSVQQVTLYVSSLQPITALPSSGWVEQQHKRAEWLS